MDEYKGEYNLQKCVSEYLLLQAERSEWIAEWRDISDFLIPGRGLYLEGTTPRKRKLTSPYAINTTARDALRVLTSGMQGGLIPSNRPWLVLNWQDARIKGHEQLSNWLFECTRILLSQFTVTNFYPVMHSFFTECGGFGTGAVFIDSTTKDKPFAFQILTAGEYVFSTDANGIADKFYRLLYKTPRQLVDQFGEDNVSEGIAKIVSDGNQLQEVKDVPMLECVLPEPYLGKPFRRIFWEIGGVGQFNNINNALADVTKLNQTPLGVDGFHEFPVPIGRWDTVGQDDYGLGPGSEALPEIKRLQDMEKGLRMGVHKDLDPPLNLPAYMRGKMSSLPGSRTYYRDPKDLIYNIYDRPPNFQGISAIIERVEQGIKDKFFNDIFLTSARDPNASPLKATEARIREGEKMLRLGSVIERLVPEFFNPVIERCFNICKRKGLFPELSPELEDLAGDFDIQFVSPLAQSQKLLASKSIETTVAFAANIANIQPEVLDKFDMDTAIEEYVDAQGAPRNMLRDQASVQAKRADRAKQQQQEMQRQRGIQEAELAAKAGPAAAQERKTTAEAGQIMTEAIAAQEEFGLM